MAIRGEDDTVRAMIERIAKQGRNSLLGDSVVAVLDPGIGMQYFVLTQQFAKKFYGRVVFAN